LHILGLIVPTIEDDALVGDAHRTFGHAGRRGLDRFE